MRRHSHTIRRSATFAAIAIAISACTPELEWREFAWTEGGFAVLLPGKPTQVGREVNLAGHRMQLVMFPVQREGLAFGVGYADLPAGLDDAARAAILAAARDQLVSKFGQPPAGDRGASIPGASGHAFESEGVVEGKQMVVAGRVYATDRRFYQIVLAGRKERVAEFEPSLFLDSFRLRPSS